MPQVAFGDLGFVARSAVVVASARVVDSKRTDVKPIVYEPLLHRLVGEYAQVHKLLEGSLEEYQRQEREEKQAHVAPFTTGRTRFGDEAVMRTLAGVGSEAQVVILGAGLDTRAWRLPFQNPETYKPPGGPAQPHAAAGAAAQKHVAVLEVDQGEMTDFKAARVRECGGQTDSSDGAKHGFPLTASRWVGVTADFREEGWAQHLKAAGFQPGSPTVWIMEGLFYYLEPPVGARLLQQIAQLSAPGSALVFSSISAALAQGAKAAVADPNYELDENMRAFYRSWLNSIEGDKAEGFFQGLGWEVVTLKDSDQVAQDYGFSPHKSKIGERLSSTYEGQYGPVKYYHIFARLLR